MARDAIKISNKTMKAKTPADQNERLRFLFTL